MPPAPALRHLASHHGTTRLVPLFKKFFPSGTGMTGCRTEGHSGILVDLKNIFKFHEWCLLVFISKRFGNEMNIF
jgi:hypothetical protein